MVKFLAGIYTILSTQNGNIDPLRIASGIDVRTIDTPEKIHKILERWKLMTGHTPAYKVKEESEQVQNLQ